MKLSHNMSVGYDGIHGPIRGVVKDWCMLADGSLHITMALAKDCDMGSKGQMITHRADNCAPWRNFNRKRQAWTPVAWEA